MTPEEFTDKMKNIYKQYYDDPEIGHERMDRCMAELLRDLGYGDGIDIFDKQYKWYC